MAREARIREYKGGFGITGKGEGLRSPIEGEGRDSWDILRTQEVCTELMLGPSLRWGLEIRGEQDGHRSPALLGGTLADGVGIVFAKASIPCRITMGEGIQATSLQRIDLYVPMNKHRSQKVSVGGRAGPWGGQAPITLACRGGQSDLLG